MINELQWQTVLYDSKNEDVPKERWGHRLVKAGDQLLMFGGYGGIKEGAGSYLNDLWSFNLNTYRWEQLKTQGDIPEARSNYTIHYWLDSDSVIVFGGGSDNKKRFNSTSILDVETLTWRTLSIGETEQGPWERTYHSSQIHEHYLIVYGGEGAAGIDMDDLWALDLEQQKWIKLEPKGRNPQRRRFATSVMVGSDLYIIGGCKDYYKQIGDCHKLSLLPLIEGRMEELEWETIFENSKLIERWGHSANVHENSIYIFAGRIKTAIDDSELMEYDCKTGLLTKIKTFGKIPCPRRRHATIMLGDCLLVFGGYNDQYFNDFSFIKLPKKTSTVCAHELQEVKSSVQYQMAIAKLERLLFPVDKLKVISGTKSAYVSTCIGRLQEKNIYFSKLFKYENELILPEFCSIDLARIVLLSVINSRVFVWQNLPISECMELVQAFEYFCSSQLRNQMELYIMKRVTVENTLTIIEAAINHKLPKLANYAASIHLATYQDQAMSYVTYNKNRPDLLNKVLAVLDTTEARIKFQLDQAHLQALKTDFTTKVCNFFKYMICNKQKPLKRIKGIPRYNKLASSASNLIEERNYINPDQYS